MISFFQNYPLRYYWQTLVRRPSSAHVVIALNPDRTNMLIKSRAGRTKYFQDIQKQPGAPVINTPAQPQGPFRGLLSTSGIAIGGKYIFVPAVGDVELKLIAINSLAGIESVEQLRATSMTALLPTFDRHQLFEWDFLSPSLCRLSGKLPESVLVVGIPIKLRCWIESWTESMGGEVVATVPALAASLRWCCKKTEGLVILLGSKESHLALFAGGELKLLERQLGSAALMKSPELLVNEIREIGAEFPNISVSVFQGDVPNLKAREFNAKLSSLLSPMSSTMLVAAPTEGEKGKAGEAATPLEAAVMEELIS